MREHDSCRHEAKTKDQTHNQSCHIDRTGFALRTPETVVRVENDDERLCVILDRKQELAASKYSIHTLRHTFETKHIHYALEEPLQRPIGAWTALALLLVFGSWPRDAQSQKSLKHTESQLKSLIDKFQKQQLVYDPTAAYFGAGSTLDNVHLPDHSPEAIRRLAIREQADLSVLTKLDASVLSGISRASYAGLREQLESDLQMGVCRHELWNVNHFTGWQVAFIQIAQRQPVKTKAERDQALARWGLAFPLFVDTEIANLKLGQSKGYSAPQSVVKRVIRQVTALAESTPEKSPFYSPAERSHESGFEAAIGQTIAAKVNPALLRYRDYLQTEYLLHARTSVAVTDLPNGEACYAAFLRSNTTSELTAAEIYALGKQTVNGYHADVLRFGKEAYGKDTFEDIISAMNADPANHFTSRDDLLAKSKAMISVARDRTAATLIDHMPRQEVTVEPLADFEEQTGATSRMEGQSDTTKPEIFKINLGKWPIETLGEAEVTAAHEVWPGHGLQLATAAEIAAQSHRPFLFSNNAYAEGWARYAEGLAEETGILTTPAAKIQRRLASQGILLDPGLHAFHWTQKQAVDALVSTGRYTPSTAEATVDRIAAMPGQLTAYDVGRLEIERLRDEAQEKLGSGFDLRTFNRVILEEGNVPLSELRRHVHTWLSADVNKSH